MVVYGLSVYSNHLLLINIIPIIQFVKIFTIQLLPFGILDIYKIYQIVEFRKLVREVVCLVYLVSTKC